MTEMLRVRIPLKNNSNQLSARQREMPQDFYCSRTYYHKVQILGLSNKLLKFPVWLRRNSAP